MASLTYKLEKQGLITPPSFLVDNIHYEVIMGSEAYGCNDISKSDKDIYGFCVPPKRVVFPHTNGVVLGFDRDSYEKFEQYQQHHIKYDTNKEADISIYNIVTYFRLVADCNPNMLDSLFVDRECIIHISQLGEMVRESRKLFLHKGLWFKYKGYAMSQSHKIKTKNPIATRKDIMEEQGSSYDRKFAYHLVRLLLECEQLLEHGDMDLRLHKEHYKAIRRGDFTKEEVLEFASEKEKHLEKLFENCKLPERAREPEIKQLLINCLEHHFGSLEKCLENPDQNLVLLRQIKELVRKVK
jgi:predicted nucleotidyltransferase